MYSPSELNSKQEKAVTSDSRILIINAGPGTGKTKTLVSRIIHLIVNKTVSPSSVLAITFTKKAATEMKERLKNILPDKMLPFIGTFHSFALENLSKEKKITLATEQKRNEIIEKILQSKEFSSISKKEAVRTISLYKSKIKPQSDNPNPAVSVEEEFVKAYSNSLKSQELMDFDDVLLDFYELLQNSQKRQTLQNRSQHIMVDEFQDTNEVQYEIIKILTSTTNSLCIIGDPLQSIYSFRGASASIFSQVLSDFPEAIQITLPVNYRSSKYIIHVSSQLFPQSAKLIPDRSVDGIVSLIHTVHEYAEADFVLRMVSQLVGGTDLLQAAQMNNSLQPSCFADVAVIYRNHRVSSILQEKFLNSGIPFQVIGEGTPYEQKEIRSIIDSMQFIYDTKHQKVSKIGDYPSIKTHTDAEMLLYLYEKNAKLTALIQKIAQHFGSLEQLKDKKEEMINLMQFQNAFAQFDTAKNSLEKAISYIRYLHDHEYYDANCDKVTFLTMHASKGLEFKHVIICGFEDDIIPGKKLNSNIEEEKRLLYVAMTRAKDSLYLVVSRSRNKKVTSVSRFKNLIESEFLQEQEDDATDNIRKRAERNKIKKSQMKLF